jgi:hypothetical protein
LAQAQRAVPDDEANRPTDPEDKNREREAQASDHKEHEKKPSLIRRHHGFVVQLDPDGSVVAAVIPSADVLFDLSLCEAGSNLRAQKEVVDAESGVASVRVTEVVPEGVDALVRMKVAECVRPALVDKTPKGIPHFDAEERVVRPAFRLVDVEFGRHNVVADEDDWHFQLEQLCRVVAKSRRRLNQRSL